jgi:CheY-like chemotaxis protein
VVVLLVEDEQDARTLTATLLERQGARVIAVATAREALEALESEVPDVLLSDIAMPGMDGYELIRRIREREPWSAIPAAALTAFVSPTDRGRALLAGFDTHVPKPVEPAELMAVVAALSERGSPTSLRKRAFSSVQRFTG